MKTRPVREWLALLDSAAGLRMLEGVYGAGSPRAVQRRGDLVGLVNRWRERYGDGPLLLARAPGRLNIMGRHVDHQGGYCNLMAIDRDTWLAAGPRADRTIRLTDIESERFPDREFSLDELPPSPPGPLSQEQEKGSRWRAYVDSPAVRELAAAARGDWAQYVKAALARAQAIHPLPLYGMDVASMGDVPVAAGLSSSSTVVVATMEAVCALNGISLPQTEFVERCGEAEWFVGTRGGAADHAAMKCAQRDRIVRVRFFPFRVTDSAPLPAGCCMVICNSRQEARKTAGAGDRFNHRVACYHLGRELIKARHPELAGGIEHLRDISADHLGIAPEEIVRLVAELPETMDRAGLRSLLPEEITERYFASHSEGVGPYPIRAVVLFGLAECERSRRAEALLEAGRLEEFGQWMSVSHNGDRVCPCPPAPNSGGACQAQGSDRPRWSDRWIEELAAEIAGGRPLALEPGGYGCSTPEIDQMVDVARSVPGVYGAQLSGAGLGGCMMALAREEAVAPLTAAMTAGYYEPTGLEPAILACRPGAGSGVIGVPGV